MADERSNTVRDIFLCRQGIVFVESSSGSLPQEVVQAAELEFAAIGYVWSSKLRAQLRCLTVEELLAFSRQTIESLLQHVGGGDSHVPLFRHFPEGIPGSTSELWWQKVLVHYLQKADQPCIFCGECSITHVLAPCQHVVCDECFDGTNYSACPICEHHVNSDSPFFTKSPHSGVPSEHVQYKRLDLGDDEKEETRQWFIRLCQRTQALSPTDQEFLRAIVLENSDSVLGWLPATIPVRENTAIIFGTLFTLCQPEVVVRHARRYLTTATDVLRCIAVLSGCDGSLLPAVVFKQISRTDKHRRFWGAMAKLFNEKLPSDASNYLTIPLKVSRFKVAPLARPLRRTFLQMLDAMNPIRLMEDMLRHQSFWVWVAEFLHPGEYAKRYPVAFQAFQLIRKKDVHGNRPPLFRTWYSLLEECGRQKNIGSLLKLLEERPGEFARRLDWLLRLAGQNAATTQDVVSAFLCHLQSYATPLLLTLKNHLSLRAKRANFRVYWPKSSVALGVSGPDERRTLSPEVIEQVVNAITEELLKRFASKQQFGQCILDDGLKSIIVPFNERTASPSAASIPRGSKLEIPFDKTCRLFLHWCEPQTKGRVTDLDLSVAFYDDQWKYVGVCSFWELKCVGKDSQVIAQSSGDLRNAPWPDGASEFVDLHVDAARNNGARYAVAVINNYSGMAFSQLERGYAGLMLRSDTSGSHFDPRTVENKFNLSGENGIFMPLVIDFERNVLHWLDVQTKGELEMNNVETSNKDISKVCSRLMSYFEDGNRASIWQLALLHGAARCKQVMLRGPTTIVYDRRENETAFAFYQRISAVASSMEKPHSANISSEPVLAFLLRGNLRLPEQSSIYALFRDQLTPTIAASDLLS